MLRSGGLSCGHFWGGHDSACCGVGPLIPRVPLAAVHLSPQQHLSHLPQVHRCPCLPDGSDFCMGRKALGGHIGTVTGVRASTWISGGFSKAYRAVVVLW